MSFQDVRARPGRVGGGVHQQHGTFGGGPRRGGGGFQEPGQELENAPKGCDPRRVSGEILRYQREVGRLVKSVHGMDQMNSSNQFKLKMRLEEVQKQEQNIENELQQMEHGLKEVSKKRASDCRATHMKLTRDFRKTQSLFRGLNMDFRKKQGSHTLLNEDKENSFRSMNGGEGGGLSQTQLLVQEEAAEQIMRDREAEIVDINKKMHQVNEIYKDLGELVNNQQEQIDQVENMMDNANADAQNALHRIEHANAKAGGTIPTTKGTTADAEMAAADPQCNWMLPMESFHSCINEIGNDLSGMKRRAVLFFSFSGASS